MKSISRKKTRLFYTICKVSLACIVSFALLIGGYSLFLGITVTRNSFISPLSLVNEKKNNDIVTLLSSKNIAFSRAEASESAILVTLASGEEILFSTSKSYDMQISSLQLILSRLTIEGRKIKSLDFRFDKPVIIFR